MLYWWPRVDGDQATNGSKDEEKIKEATKVTKEVKEVQAMVRNITSLAAGSSAKWRRKPSNNSPHPLLSVALLWGGWLL